MPLQTRVSGKWKDTLVRVMLSGEWKQSPQVHVRTGGEWKPLYGFSWESGAWGECSATCGGGTQSRTVRAKRSDGQYFNDTIGMKFAGEKPDTSQECNTHECTECRYDENNVWTITQTSMNAAGECIGWSIGMVLWDGETVWGDDGVEDSATINGYTYTRTTLQSETGDGGCPPKHGMQHNRTLKYTVCRSQV